MRALLMLPEHAAGELTRRRMQNQREVEAGGGAARAFSAAAIHERPPNAVPTSTSAALRKHAPRGCEGLRAESSARESVLWAEYAPMYLCARACARVTRRARSYPAESFRSCIDRPVKRHEV